MPTAGSGRSTRTPARCCWGDRAPRRCQRWQLDRSGAGHARLRCRPRGSIGGSSSGGSSGTWTRCPEIGPASVATTFPLFGGLQQSLVEIDGRPPPDGAATPRSTATMLSVGPRYFESLGVSLSPRVLSRRRGRLEPHHGAECRGRRGRRARRGRADLLPRHDGPDAVGDLAAADGRRHSAGSGRSRPQQRGATGHTAGTGRRRPAFNPRCRYERRRRSITRLFVFVYGHASASVNCSVHNSRLDSTGRIRLPVDRIRRHP